MDNYLGRKYLYGFSWVFLERIFRVFFQFFIGVYVARYLGPEDFGRINYAIAYVGLFVPFSALGLENCVISEIVKQKEKGDTVVRNSFILRFLGGIVMIILVGLSLLVFQIDRTNSLLIVLIASSAIFYPFESLDYYLQAREKFKAVGFVRNLQTICASLVKVAGVLLGADILFFGFLPPLEAFVFAVVLSVVAWRSGFSFKDIQIQLNEVFSLFHKTLPLAVSALVIAIYMKSDQVMIDFFLGSKQVGFYSIAVRLCESIYLLPICFSAVIFPSMIEAKKKSIEVFLQSSQRLFDVLLLCGLLATGLVFFFSDFIVISLFGNEYAKAVGPLKVYIWILPFFSMGQISGRWCIVEKLEKHTLFRTSVGALINVCLNIVLIPAFGIVGAAYSTLIAFFFSDYFYFSLFPETKELFAQMNKSFNLPSAVRRVLYGVVSV